MDTSMSLAERKGVAQLFLWAVANFGRWHANYKQTGLAQ
jgi:hypothetical protein